MNDRASALVTVNIPSLQMSEEELCAVLQGSVYPGAKIESVKLAVGYCKAQLLDPMLKPVHIVPMDVPTGKKDADGWDVTEKRDVIMPGIGLYRIQASRTGEHVGTSEPEYGPDVVKKLGETETTFPEWCRVTVFRIKDGRVCEYPAKERWLENYASKSRSKKDPNKMWAKRPYAQLAKCAEAQALRKGFPEIGSQPTAEEMEGKTIDDADGVTIDGATGQPISTSKPLVAMPQAKASSGLEAGTTESATPSAKPSDPPRSEAGGGADVTTGTPLSSTQVRILKKRMEGATLTDLDFKAKFGCDIEVFPATRFNDAAAWVTAPQG